MTRNGPEFASPEAVLLGELVALIGGEVLRSVLLPDPDSPVTGVWVYEAHPTREPDQSEIVLAIGMESVRELTQLLEERASRNAAIVLKCRVDDDVELIRVAADMGCAALILADQVDWLQVMALIQGQIHSQQSPPNPPNAGTPRFESRDLFELADLAADAAGGPVTIEDDRGWLLAYSSGPAPGDSVRVQTLISRRSPKDFIEALGAKGIIQDLAHTTRPLIVSNIAKDVSDRLAVRLTAGSYPLGSMWALVTAPNSNQVNTFGEIARRVSSELMRRDMENHRSHSVELEQLAVLLHGGAPMTSVDGSLALPPGSHWVVALALAPTDPAERAATRSQLEQQLALTPRPAELTVHTGQLSNLWYLIVTWGGESPPTSARVSKWVEQVLTDRTGSPLSIHAGVGSGTPNRSELPRSRREAERVLAVARVSGQFGQPLTFDRYWARAVLLRLMDQTLVADLESSTPLHQLRRYDKTHGTGYVETLRAWLNCQGNIRMASETLNVHTNTLRYRLEKLKELSQLNLDDPDVLLVLALQLSTGDSGTKQA